MRLFRSEGQVVAEVRDRGCGFVASVEADGRTGLGLIGMQERAQMIGGRLCVDSELGKGTLVRVTLPIQSEVARE